MDNLWKLVLAFIGLLVIFSALVMAGISLPLLQSAIFWITLSVLGATFLGTASLACFEVAKYYRRLNASLEADEGAPALSKETLRALVQEVVAEEEARQDKALREKARQDKATPEPAPPAADEPKQTSDPASSRLG